MTPSLFEIELEALDNTVVAAAALTCAIEELGGTLRNSQGVRVQRRAWPYLQRDVGLEDFEDETVRRLCRSGQLNLYAV
jgi:hypothetical protein